MTQLIFQGFLSLIGEEKSQKMVLVVQDLFPKNTLKIGYLKENFWMPWSKATYRFETD